MVVKKLGPKSHAWAPLTSNTYVSPRSIQYVLFSENNSFLDPLIQKYLQLELSYFRRKLSKNTAPKVV